MLQYIERKNAQRSKMSGFQRKLLVVGKKINLSLVATSFAKVLKRDG